MLSASSVSADQGWRAELRLEASQRGRRTVLSRNQHQGPLRVQRPFYPEGGVCHVYILHPPGGIVAGDSLNIDVHCGADSRLLLTTPSAGRVYCSNPARLVQRQRTRLCIESGAHGEWLPQENIVFDNAEAEAGLEVSLAEGAHFSGWEITCFGRPAAQAPFNAGRCTQRWSIYRERRPLFLESGIFAADSGIMEAHWGLGGATVCGTLISTWRDQQTLDSLRQLLAEHGLDPGATGGQPGRVRQCALTLLPDLLIIRAFGDTAAAVKDLFIAAWRQLRFGQYADPAAAPRIWAT